MHRAAAILRHAWLYCLFSILLMPMAAAASDEAGEFTHPWLLVTNAAADSISYVDPEQGVMAKLAVGTAPFGITTDRHGRAYVATAEGVAVVDITARERLALIPYQADIGSPDFGEYRKGGMGIDVSADGRLVYVGVFLGDADSRLEVVDSLQRKVVASYPVGKRPFDVLLSDDEKRVYSIDHDAYSVTAIDLSTGSTEIHPVAPLGYGAFDKPHYAVFDPTGKLLLPVQGRALVRLDPVAGRQERFRLSADTHQHGVAISGDGRRLVIVGTGAAGSARKGPSITVYDLDTDEESVFALQRTHEDIVLSSNGRYAYLTGGQSFSGGWDGVSVLDLDRKVTRYLSVPDQPLALVTIANPATRKQP